MSGNPPCTFGENAPRHICVSHPLFCGCSIVDRRMQDPKMKPYGSEWQPKYRLSKLYDIRVASIEVQARKGLIKTRLEGGWLYYNTEDTARYAAETREWRMRCRKKSLEREKKEEGND